MILPKFGHLVIRWKLDSLQLCRWRGKSANLAFLPFHHNDDGQSDDDGGKEADDGDDSESDDCYGKDPADVEVHLLPPLAHKHGHPQLRPGQKEKDLEYNHDKGWSQTKLLKKRKI